MIKTPKELYERICDVRRKRGVGGDEASRIVAKELEASVGAVWEQLGPWLIRLAEQKLFTQYGFTGGQYHSDAQSARAVREPLGTEDGVGHSAYDTQASSACSSSAPDQQEQVLDDSDPNESDREGGQPKSDTQVFAAASLPDSPASRSEGRQTAIDAQPSFVSRRPWMQRISWDLDREWGFEGVGRMRFVDANHSVLRTAERVCERTGDTYHRKARAYKAIREYLPEDDSMSIMDVLEGEGPEASLVRGQVQRLMQ